MDCFLVWALIFVRFSDRDGTTDTITNKIEEGCRIAELTRVDVIKLFLGNLDLPKI